MPPHVKLERAHRSDHPLRGEMRRLGAARFVRIDRGHAARRAVDKKSANAAVHAGAWKELLSDSVLVSGSMLVCHAMGVVTSLLFRVLVSPAQMGVWQGLKMFLSYGNYLNLGVSKGAARELAIANGRGAPEQAEQGLHAAFTANTLASVLLAGGLLMAGVWTLQFRGGWSNPWAGGLLAMAVLVMLQRYETFLVTLQRARRQFQVTSRLAVLEATLTLAIGGIATWLWGLTGLYVSAGVVLLAAIAYLSYTTPIRLQWNWNSGELRRLTAIGLPMLLAGVLSSLFRSLDKIMILICLADGEYQLGCYSVALLVGTQLYGVANQLAMVGAPRYAELWGQSGDRRAVASYVAQNSVLVAWGLACCGLLAIVLGAPLLGWLLPKYTTGLPALVWLAPGVAAAGLALPLTNYLATIDRQARSITLLVGATMFTAAVLPLVLSRGGGLVGVAGATSLASLGYLVLLARASIWPELNERDKMYYQRHLLGALLLLSLPAVFSAVAPLNASSGRALVVVGLVGAWGLAAACGWLWGVRRKRLAVAVVEEA